MATDWRFLIKKFDAERPRFLCEALTNAKKWCVGPDRHVGPYLREQEDDEHGPCTIRS